MALNTVMGTVWDKRYGKEHAGALSPANLLINLFGVSGVGAAIAKNLSAGIPDATAVDEPTTTVKVIDTTAIDVTDEKDATPGPGITQEE